MSKTTLVVGLDGSAAGEKALAFAKKQAKQLGDCTIAICYVIEWSPFSFQTPEENEKRHLRREEAKVATATAMASSKLFEAAVKLNVADCS